MSAHRRRALTAATVVLCAQVTVAVAQHGAAGDDWLYPGGDAGFTRYSPLADIDKGNVERLTVAWAAPTPDADVIVANPRMRATNFENTPLAVGGTLYATTPLAWAYAIDGASGELLWSHDAGGYDTSRRGSGLTFVNRGMATRGSGADRRLYSSTRDGRLFALVAATGEPDYAFGDNGEVDIKVGLPRITSSRQVGLSSAPAVCGDVVIAGSRISDGATKKTAPPGWIRAFDARTGAERWTFHLVPEKGEFGEDTWEDGSNAYTGASNAWGMLSVDQELEMLFVPTSTPTNDFFGGARVGDNLFAESIVAIDCKTGERAWHFQVIHHGLWDYDLAAAPILTDIEVDGRAIAAVSLVTKHGFVFVFDRRTGEPVWPISERPVPPSTVPGEHASPTQPYPLKPPPFERQGITKEDLIDFTPELRAEAEKILETFVHGPMFLPPAEKPTLLLPSYGGGANWPGAAFDPETGRLYVPSMTRLLVMTLQEPDQSRSDMAFVNRGGKAEGPEGLPLVKPPYGRVTAYDLNRGEILWKFTNGGDGPRDHPAIAHLDLPPLGTATRAGVLVTKTLLFATDGSGRSGSAIGGGNGFRAFDKATGEELWRTELPGHATGVPMTYRAAGRQYVAVAVGTEPPQLVAFAVPEE